MNYLLYYAGFWFSKHSWANKSLNWLSRYCCLRYAFRVSYLCSVALLSCWQAVKCKTTHSFSITNTKVRKLLEVIRPSSLWKLKYGFLSVFLNFFLWNSQHHGGSIVESQRSLNSFISVINYMVYIQTKPKYYVCKLPTKMFHEVCLSFRSISCVSLRPS